MGDNPDVASPHGVRPGARYAGAVTGHVIDDRWLGALHVSALRAAGVDHDPVVERGAFQVGTLESLMGGAFDGESTIEQLLAHGGLGLGTVNHLAGEMVIVDDVAYLCDVHATARVVGADEHTPFGVVSPFCDLASRSVHDVTGVEGLTILVHDVAGERDGVLAIRLEGHFVAVRVRNVHPQHPPYVSLARAVRDQVEFTLADVQGSLVGFRFPDEAAGVEVPGFHLHFITANRTRGGHVLDVVGATGVLSIDVSGELRVELPAGVGLGIAGAADRATINAVEAQRA